MKTKKQHFATIFILILFSATISFSQNSQTGKELAMDKTIGRDGNNTTQKTVLIEEESLATEINTHRISGNKVEAERLQNQLFEMQGVVSKTSETVIPMEQVNNSASTTMSASEVFSVNGITAIGTATEQRGPNTGRIWAVVLYDEVGNASTRTSYSDDDGVNWTQYSYGTLPGYSSPVFHSEGIDVEIIENYNGAKYLHFVFGTKYNSNYKNVCWLGSLNIGFGTFSGSYHLLTWMGFNLTDASLHYVFPRITSDNAFYHDIPWIYISVGSEVHGSSTFNFNELTAIISSPFTALPSISSSNVPFYHIPLSVTNWFAQNCDIAWFYDPLQTIPGGSIQLIERSQDYSYIFLFQSEAVSFLTGGNYEQSIFSNGTTFFAKIASNGFYNNLMVAFNIPATNGIAIKYLSSVNSGVDWSQGFLTPDIYLQGKVDIVGARNQPGRFFSSISGINTTSTYEVKYRQSYNNTWDPLTARMNHLDASTAVGSAAGFKLNGQESCFVLWSNLNGDKVFATKDCSGNIHQSIRFNVGVLIEGFYRTSTYSTVSDTVTVSLRKFTPPYSILETKKAVLDASGYCVANFSEINSTTNYFVIINHRNSIGMWSALPINFGGGTVGYATYTSSNTLAYGDNLKYLATRPVPLTKYFGMYSGDVNQDEVIDGTDMSIIDTDILLFLPPGYYQSDVNGDTVVDGSDFAITDNNAAMYITFIRP